MDNAVKDDNSNAVTVEREIVVNGIKIKLTSDFVGDKTLVEKLFILAERKLKSD